MDRALRLIGRVIWSPVLGLMVGVAVAWTYIRGKHTDVPPNGDDVGTEATNPEDDHDDRERTWGKDVWAKDLTPHQRCRAVEMAQKQDGLHVDPVIPFLTWVTKRAAANRRRLG